MNKKEAKKFVYSALANFLDPSIHDNSFIQEDADGTPFNEHDIELCNNILKDIVEKFRVKSKC